MTTRDRRLRGPTPAKAGNAGAVAEWENEGGSLPAPPLDPRDREDAAGGRGRHPRRVRRSALEREVRQGAMRTVENHRAKLMGQLGLSSRVELVSYAEEHDLLE